MAAPAWYRRHDELRERIGLYLTALWGLPPDAPHHSEIAAFQEFCAVKMLFESNLIEEAGLSEGKTRKVVAENFPRIPYDFERFRAASLVTSGALTTEEDVDRLFAAYEAHGLDEEKVIPSVSFHGRSRAVVEVLGHYTAYIIGRSAALEYSKRLQEYILLKVMLKRLGFRKRAGDLWDRLGGEARARAVQMPVLFTEDLIRQIQKTMAEGIEDDDWGVAAGEYRIDNRSVGLEVAFPAPALVPGAMREFVARANARMAKPDSLYRVAAQISYDFVRVHPFPDFNGRTSRILAAMVLHGFGVPFAPSIRGDKKGKHRYFWALRKANNGDIDPLACLIAASVLKAFDDVDANIVRAGLRSLLTFRVTDEQLAALFGEEE
jgi:fido (protein-threonine AMPylation protein)